ncbi:sugar transferase [Plastoroseomonas arctica]|uniref:Sugar transferase n=1 Tax=Plastoroseomonas arctica TaxID=1509237 RepID=A0AAF1JZ36_9PROT|nr:sugar transferase [Plastoroseomonas arctica]MBR0656380.1 sugar transferase [Plastoroseomonas arctica]
MPERGFYARRGKRALDIVAVLAMAPVALPLLALAALAVWAVLGRPVVFRSTRIGRGGVSFTMGKLRSMAEGDGPDPERTGRFGRALRASALDELPQLWHVLRGQMSLVGPRPLPAHYAPVLPGARHSVRPGLTGLAQVAGRNALPWPTRLRLDCRYASAPSLGRDLRILGATVVVLMRRRGGGIGVPPGGLETRAIRHVR